MKAWLLLLVAGCSFQAGAAIDSGRGSSDASVPAGWWDTSWTVRVPIAISNGSSNPLPAGYQVGLPYDIASAPCASAAANDDVRIVFDGSAEQARVIDRVGPPVWTWFRLAAELAPGESSGSDYFLYCRNATAGPAPKAPATVFDFFDGFDSGVGSAWTAVGGAAVSSGELVCPSTSMSGVVSVASYGAGEAVDYIGAPAGANDFWWGGFQNGTDAQPWAIWYADLDTNSVLYPSVANGTISLGSAFSEGTTPHLYGVENYGNAVMWRLDDVPYASQAESNLPAMFGVRLWNGAGGGNAQVSFDSVRVRQAVSPAPVVTAGSAESL